MSKRSTAESIDKLKSLIEGNDGISVHLQLKLMKHVNQIAKHVKPVEPKEKRQSGTSQFEKKMPISSEMSTFAKWPFNCEKSRVEVTRAVWDYVKDKELRDEKNKRVCILDKELKNLLGTDEPTLTYPQIQKYIGKHFVKV